MHYLNIRLKLRCEDWVLASVTSWVLTAEYFTIRLLLTRLLIHLLVLPPSPTCSFIPSSCYPSMHSPQTLALHYPLWSQQWMGTFAL